MAELRNDKRRLVDGVTGSSNSVVHAILCTSPKHIQRMSDSLLRRRISRTSVLGTTAGLPYQNRQKSVVS
jgi:hypothetical protein